ncbi:MAG: LPS export ABC transporter permease LptF [Rhizobiales bacterium]|nr:LPS export ABC transporter permease LptF [Hyphomicrobiales bacterium]
MKLIERYIFRRAFVVFAAALGWTLAIVWTTQVLERIDLVTTNGQSVLAFLELATLIIPSVAPMVMPFAVAIGVAHTLSVMNTDSELVVINASGSSRASIIKPMLLIGLGVSIASFAVDNGIDPYARQHAREMVAAARADLLSSVIQEGTFRRVEKGVFLQVGERRPDGLLGSIFIADSRDPQIDLVYYAKTGAVTNIDGRNLLLMREGVVHRRPAGREVSVVRFDSYAFDLSLLAPEDQAVMLFPKDQTLGYLMEPDRNDWFFQHYPTKYRAELHRRLADWMYPLVFSLIALAVAGDARSHREARVHPMLTVLTIALLVRWAGFGAANGAEGNPGLVWAIYGVPLVTMAVCAWFIRTNRTLELPVALTERMLGLVARLLQQVAMWRRRLLRQSADAGESA